MGEADMKAWLFCGAKIVCVDAYERPELSVGRQYTIRKIGMLGDATSGQPVSFKGKYYALDMLVIWLEGLRIEGQYVNRAGIISDDYPYSPDRFRPVSTIDTTRAVEALRKLTLNTRIDA